MNIRRIFPFVLLLCFASTAAAQETLYTGPAQGDWNNPANWSNGLPDASFLNAIVGDDLFNLNAEVNITGDLTEPVIGDLRIAANGAGSFGNITGIVNHSAGSLTTIAENWSFIGADGSEGAPNIGTYNLSGTASFSTAGGGTEFHVGSFSVGGALGANEGYVNVSDTASMNMNRVYIGSRDGSIGELNQTGGAVEANSWLAIGRELDAVGTYNISSGSLTVNDDFLTVGENTGASGTLNVSGDAQVSAVNLSVGRFAGISATTGNAASGLMTITGDSASIETDVFWVGIENDAMMPSPAMGTISFTSDGDVSPIMVTGDVHLNDGSVIGSSTLEIDLSGSSVTGNVLLISVGGTLNGTFSNLGEGDMVPNSGDRTITYMGGDGNDIVLLGESTVVDGDFNMDGMWNCTDIDALVAAIASGSTDLSFDMNGDGLITADDVTDMTDGWLAVGGAHNPGQTSGNAFLVGDANLDGIVDGLDFIEWNNNKFTSIAEWCAGDFNADGVVDGLDFIGWNANKFTSSTGVAVPEPGLGLCWLVGLLFLARRQEI